MQGAKPSMEESESVSKSKLPGINRIESIDIMRGLVMVIMALDHTRAYFHYGSFFINPTDMETTTPVLFFTRFITHYCAPVFVFLAGTSAFMVSRKKPKKELFKFLFTRGVWLIFLEFIVNNLIWTFDPTYSKIVLQVIWAIGFSMVCLSFLIYLPKKIIFIIGIILVAGHNLLDGIVYNGQGLKDIIWYLLHQRHFIDSPDFRFVFGYPVIPWVGLMALGFCFGILYEKEFEQSRRKKWLLALGIGLTVIFFILRGLNIYGDLVPWSQQKNTVYTVLSFFNVTKYPPSLDYLLITIGPTLILLYLLEYFKPKITDFLLVFGKVPLFFYFLHVFVIHAFAVLGLWISGEDWHRMILTAEVFQKKSLLDYGYSLWLVYAVWILVIFLLYPLSKKYMHYKANNKNKWWLSYL